MSAAQDPANFRSVEGPPAPRFGDQWPTHRLKARRKIRHAAKKPRSTR